MDLFLRCFLAVTVIWVAGAIYFLATKQMREERERREEEERHQRKLIQDRIQWILQYGTEEQKQTLLLLMENQELQRIREMVALDIFMDLF